MASGTAVRVVRAVSDPDGATLRAAVDGPVARSVGRRRRLTTARGREQDERRSQRNANRQGVDRRDVHRDPRSIPEAAECLDLELGQEWMSHFEDLAALALDVTGTVNSASSPPALPGAVASITWLRRLRFVVVFTPLVVFEAYLASDYLHHRLWLRCVHTGLFQWACPPRAEWADAPHELAIRPSCRKLTATERTARAGGWSIRVTSPPSCGVVCSTSVQREGSSPNEEATFASFPPGFEGRRNGCDRGLFVVRQQHPIKLHRQYDRQQRSGRHRFDRRFDGQRYRRHGGHDHRERYDRCFDWRREHDGQRDHGNRYHGQRNDG